jgi:hypothetical protein
MALVQRDAVAAAHYAPTSSKQIEIGSRHCPTTVPPFRLATSLD